MIQIRRMLVVTILLLCAGTVANAQEKYLETVKVADDIYVFKPKIDWTHGNGVAIIGKDGVFFVDTYIQTNYAEEAIKLLKKITKLPVLYVLNTHWHYDHVMGNEVFKKAYPRCKIVMHDSTYGFMATNVKRKIDSTAKDIQSDIRQLKKEIEDKKMQGGTILTESMIPFWELQLREAQEYERSFKGNNLVNADITFSDSLTFRWGQYTLNLIHAADKGHSPGDAILWIPEKKLVVTGDIVVAPTPYATYINAPGLVRSLQKIIDMAPSIIIPGHGEVEYNLNYVSLLHKAFSSYLAAAEKAVDDKIPLAEAFNKTSFPEIDIQFTGDDDVKKWAYRAFFKGNLFRNTYRRRGVIK